MTPLLRSGRISWCRCPGLHLLDGCRNALRETSGIFRLKMQTEPSAARGYGDRNPPFARASTGVDYPVNAHLVSASLGTFRHASSSCESQNAIASKKCPATLNCNALNDQ